MVQETSSTLVWRKSSFSGSSGCVEVAGNRDRVYVRDSEDPSGAVVSCTAHDWTVFIKGVELGEFALDRLTDDAVEHRHQSAT